MPNSELAEKILAENKALRADVEALGGKLDTLEDKGRHTRWGVYLLTALVVAAFMYWGYSETNDRIDEQVEYDVSACERGNETRAAQRKQWTDTQALLNRYNDKATDRLAANLVANANKNFAELDCSAIRRGEKPPPVTPAPAVR